MKCLKETLLINQLMPAKMRILHTDIYILNWRSKQKMIYLKFWQDRILVLNGSTSSNNRDKHVTLNLPLPLAFAFILLNLKCSPGHYNDHGFRQHVHDSLCSNCHIEDLKYTCVCSGYECCRDRKTIFKNTPDET